MTTLSSNSISEDAQKLSNLANENLEQLSGYCQNKEEVQDYYLGQLRRQAIILFDLSKIMHNRDVQFISTPFILLRSLLDDFLHVLYLELHENKESEITKITASTQAHSFEAIGNLTESNYKYFQGKYPYYLTNEQFQEVKDIFIRKPENAKYFENIQKFKFKKFLTLTELVKRIHGDRNIEIFRDRAYFSWKEFSDFIHYSNYSFQYELNPDYSYLNLQKLDEGLQFCYNTIYLSFKFFEKALGLDFIDKEELNKKYGIIHRC